MERRVIQLEECIPIAFVADGAILARDGSLTIGYELYPREEYSLTQEQYDTQTRLMASAFRTLPEWTMVHKQDIYRKRRYHCDPEGHFLDECYCSHFEGRAYLEHREFLWLSFNPAIPGRPGAMKGALQGAAGGIRYRPPKIKDLEGQLSLFENRCQEFVTAMSAGGALRFRRVRTEELEGVPGGEDGLIEEYKRWFGSPMDGTDIIQTDGTYLDRDTRRMFSYSFSSADDFPGEVSNTVKVRSLSSGGGDILLSSASEIGSALPYEHIVNCYWLLPNQQSTLNQLERRRKDMTAMSKGSAENTVHAEGIAHFIDMIHAEASMAIYSHMNLIAWGPREEELTIRGEAGAAISALGLSGKLNTVDMPQLWLAGFPGGEMEIGEDNLFIAELEQAMCLSIGESFMRDFPGGPLRITDRHRHVPVRIDTQQGAYDAKLIENYNAVILGPSGTGKSFFTNWYVRNCFDAGQHVFIIDKGDSYEGLCALIREETGGRDGVYYTWTEDQPFAFAPLEGCREWKDNPTAPGLDSFLTMLKIIWTPSGGWNSNTEPILFRIFSDFLHGLPTDGEDPVFEDFYLFVRDYVKPRILKAHGEDEYLVGGVSVTPALFDIDSFCVSMSVYSAEGQFPRLLNDRHPADLFRSRFVVFEIDAISDMKGTIYPLCTFCIMNAFEKKMRSDDEAFRLMFIEEAWQAIATEATSDWIRALWKTARKYHTSATVVTQQVSDIISSPVIKDAILNNSPVKILLDQQSNAASFEEIATLLGLSPLDRALVRSVGRDIPTGAPYKEVFISLGGKQSGVYALEVSPEEALVYESDKVKKKPLLDKAAELGSIISALKMLTKEKKDEKS